MVQKVVAWRLEDQVKSAIAMQGDTWNLSLWKSRPSSVWSIDILVWFLISHPWD